jgi:tetratricopeptide (TPR) repeat protein|tara:strand:+ start:129 stop:500 length:372 start_codon:yes stop_codon:yes gene_type:complete
MEGNQFFKAKDYAKAIKTYKDTIDVLDLINLETTRQNTTIINDLRVTTHQNMAMSLNALEKYDEAVFHCEHAIIVNEKSAKAHFIKSQAFEKQQEYEKALISIKKAIVISPNDRKLRDDLTRI